MRITEVFYQSGEPEYGIPSHWCVQYLNDGDAFVSYEYFSTQREAVDWATAHGFNA